MQSKNYILRVNILLFSWLDCKFSEGRNPFLFSLLSSKDFASWWSVSAYGSLNIFCASTSISLYYL